MNFKTQVPESWFIIRQELVFSPLLSIGHSFKMQFKLKWVGATACIRPSKLFVTLYNAWNSRTRSLTIVFFAWFRNEPSYFGLQSHNNIDRDLYLTIENFQFKVAPSYMVQLTFEISYCRALEKEEGLGPIPWTGRRMRWKTYVISIYFQK